VESLQVFEVEVFKVFVLVMVRISGMIVAAPLLGSRNFPTMAKIGLAAFISMIVTPHLAALNQPLPNDMMGFALMGAGELMIGLLIGFVMTLTFAAIQVGGQIMDMQSGFAMVNVFNPALGTQFPVFGFFLFVLAVLLLIITNGHHVMIRAIVSTFDTIPLGGFVLRPALLGDVIRWSGAMFVDGLLIAAPVTAALTVAYVIMGLLGRSIPQIQLFAVGFPLTIAVSMLVVAFSIHLYLIMMNGMFSRMFGNVAAMIRGMS
jgi:flagellar biosynthesis protein FliR